MALCASIRFFPVLSDLRTFPLVAYMYVWLGDGMILSNYNDIIYYKLPKIEKSGSLSSWCSIWENFQPGQYPNKIIDFISLLCVMYVIPS
jgi:hypothetical protein